MYPYESLRDIREVLLEDDFWAMDVSAILRSDPSTPSLCLRDEITVHYFAEWADYTQETWIHARLQGQKNDFVVAIRIDIDALYDLRVGLQKFADLSATEFFWATACQQIQLSITLDRATVGENVFCDVWLRDRNMRMTWGDCKATPLEEYHCTFCTTLPWVDRFIEGLRQMTVRFRHEQAHADQIQAMS